jgi:thiol-disulfide isomerase/thioredoxin
VVGGLIVLVVVLAAASAAGFVLRQRAGRFHPARSASTPLDTSAAGSGLPGPADRVLGPADLGAPLGPAATLVQFSTEFCAYCGPARRLLAEVAGDRDGVAFVEIDAAERMDLTRRLRVLSTPTVLVLDAGGAIKSRASGRPRKAELLAALGAVLEELPRLEFPTKSGDNRVSVGEPGDDSGAAGE